MTAALAGALVPAGHPSSRVRPRSAWLELCELRGTAAILRGTPCVSGQGKQTGSVPLLTFQDTSPGLFVWIPHSGCSTAY